MVTENRVRFRVIRSRSLISKSFRMELVHDVNIYQIQNSTFLLFIPTIF
jgi:hypothetical protein